LAPDRPVAGDSAEWGRALLESLKETGALSNRRRSLIAEAEANAKKKNSAEHLRPQALQTAREPTSLPPKNVTKIWQSLANNELS
jgi:hypothetical protein